MGDGVAGLALVGGARHGGEDLADAEVADGGLLGILEELVAEDVVDVVEVLVAAAGQIDQQVEFVAVGVSYFGELEGVRQGVGGLEGGDDAFVAGEEPESLEGVFVSDGYVLGPADLAEVSVLGADAWVVQAGGDREGLGEDFAVLTSDDKGAGAMQDAQLAMVERCAVAVGVQAFAGGFDADEFDIGVCLLYTSDAADDCCRG